MMKKNISLFVLLFFVSTLYPILTIAQIRIVCLPFENMDGNQKYNIYCYQLQDSIDKSLRLEDPEGIHYTIVALDSVETLLAEMNIDPTNPQYPSDMLKAVKMLNVQKIISGNFNVHANRMLINGYIYDIETNLPDLKNQARDIFKKEEQIMEAVPIILRKILPGLMKN